MNNETGDHYAYGAVVKLEPGKSVTFPHFTIRYEGEETAEAGLNGPTVSANTRKFNVTDERNKSQQLRVVSVQKAPEPFAFKVGPRAFVLHTYELPNGERLFPGQFSVVEKKRKDPR